MAKVLCLQQGWKKGRVGREELRSSPMIHTDDTYPGTPRRVSRPLKLTEETGDFAS
jgi:hypothetical protein